MTEISDDNKNNSLYDISMEDNEEIEKADNNNDNQDDDEVLSYLIIVNNINNIINDKQLIISKEFKSIIINNNSNNILLYLIAKNIRSLFGTIIIDKIDNELNDESFTISIEKLTLYDIVQLRNIDNTNKVKDLLLELLDEKSEKEYEIIKSKEIYDSLQGLLQSANEVPGEESLQQYELLVKELENNNDTNIENNNKDASSADRKRKDSEELPKRSKIPFNIIGMTYEEYCSKHYEIAIEDYKREKARKLRREQRKDGGDKRKQMIPPHGMMPPMGMPMPYGQVPQMMMPGGMMPMGMPMGAPGAFPMGQHPNYYGPPPGQQQWR